MLNEPSTYPVFSNANGSPRIPEPINDLNKFIPAYKFVDLLLLFVLYTFLTNSSYF